VFAPSAVVTNPFSDWSLATVELLPDQENVYVEMQRKAGNIFVRYATVANTTSSSKEMSTTPLRTVNGFTSADENESIEVGIMLCSPKSNAGVEVDFMDISIKQG
jgi:regulation of enolase protein 1 (concanavalin A-like superfamily)